MLDLFLTPAYSPFAFAFAMMIGIGAIEAVGLGIGHFDLDADADIHGFSMLDWLGIGSGMPILIWLTSLLACFTVCGVALQQVFTAVLGVPLHWAAASTAALIAGGAINRFVIGGMSRLMPTFESTVISTDDLLMRRGTVLEGSARRGHPARAKVVDQYRQAHYIMVEPHRNEDVIAQGESALLVRREGSIFFALPDTETSLRLN